MRSRTTGAGVLALFTICLSVGCQGIHDRDAVVLAESIRVGGLVNSPGEFELPPDGVDLSEAISLAGGPNLASVATVQTQSAQAKPENTSLDAFETEVAAFRDSLTGVLRSSENAVAVEPSDLKKVAKLLDDDSGVKKAFSELRKIPGLVSATEKTAVSAKDRVWNNARLDLLDPLEAGELPSEELLNNAIDALNEYENAVVDLVGSRQLLQPSSQPAVVVPDKPLLVCLKRDDVRYYYAYELVTAGEASGLSLVDGDFISLIDVHDTLLASARGNDDGTVELAGWTPNPGRFPVAELRTLGQVRGPENLDISTTRLRMVIRRTHIGDSIPSVFILPFEQTQQPGFRDFQVHPGDIISLMPDIQTPLVMDNLVGALVAEGIADRLQVQVTKRPKVSRLDRHSISKRGRMAQIRGVAGKTLRF